MTADPPATPPRRPAAWLGIGRASRFGPSRREQYLALGHLLVIAVALEDEEVAAFLVDLFGLPAGALPTMETALIIVVLAAWGLLTLGWVRCKRDG